MGWGGPQSWHIAADQRITRRKLFHIVVDPAGNGVFRSRLLSECVDFLIAKEIDTFSIFWDDVLPLSLSCVVENVKEHRRWQK